MSTKAGPDDQGTSTRPYLIRALHDWCCDNGFTPYVAVAVGSGVMVPMEYVKNNEIVLNVGFEATSGLRLGNETIEFKARFGGQAREIVVPVDHVVAIYARENGQGMAFPMPAADDGSEAPEDGHEANGLSAVPDAARSGGLRLATPSDDGGPAPTSASPRAEGRAEATEPENPPPESPPPAPTRPTLKRVK